MIIKSNFFYPFCVIQFKHSRMITHPPVTVRIKPMPSALWLSLKEFVNGDGYKNVGKVAKERVNGFGLK